MMWGVYVESDGMTTSAEVTMRANVRLLELAQQAEKCERCGREIAGGHAIIRWQTRDELHEKRIRACWECTLIVADCHGYPSAPHATSTPDTPK